MKYITLPQQIVDKALEALDFYADIEGKDYREAFKEAQQYKFDFPNNSSISFFLELYQSL